LRHRWQFAAGLGWGAIVWTLAPRFIGWVSPVLLGLLAAIPFSVVTSHATIGRRWRTWGLFVTPEESSPPPELAAARVPLEISAVGPKSVHVPALPALAILGMEPALLNPVVLQTPIGRSDAVVRSSP
jgi:membrane glycosyltransferase